MEGLLSTGPTPSSFDINRDQYIAEIQSSVREIQIGSGENPGSVTLRQHARREAGSWPIFLLNLFYTVASFTVLDRYFMYQKSASSSGGPCVLVQKGAISSSSFLHD